MAKVSFTTLVCDISATDEGDLFGQLLQLEELFVRNQVLLSWESKWGGTRTSGDQHVASLNDVSSDFESVMAAELRSTVGCIDAPFSVAPLLIGRDRAGEAALELK